jgi:nitrate reductase (NAD(P)H)
MDPNKGILLAYKMNGEMLRPDHGKPLRAVIPGQIGGRSVKWLKKLIITEGPSDNWYHLYDNRVLPTMVDPEESARNPKWWTDERYAIYDLSTNSATAYPAHEEQLCLSNGPNSYQVRGYAYGGGGRRVTRVELSLDQGQTWKLAEIEYAEDRYREAEMELYGGKLDMSWRENSFCWCLWSLNILVSEMAASKDILVRAMDESMNIQPRDMYWSVLGMMNNPWYRITISKEGDFLRFEHPTQPALLPGGWMERVKKSGGNLINGYWGEEINGQQTIESVEEAAKDIPMVKEGVNRTITIDELRKHDDEKSPWFVVNGEVYDGTAFLEGHPGGAQSIISAAGIDATDEFMAIHSETAKAMMPDYHLGTLDDAARKALVTGEDKSEDLIQRETFLQAKLWTTATLHAKRVVSWDTRVFTFKLQHETQALGLPTGQHLMIRMRDPVTRDAIIRSYTPVSETSQKGSMDVLVKIYFDTPAAKGGKMSQALDSIPIGHSVDFKGPIGKFEYSGRGTYLLNGKERKVKRFLMICGGSGVTPIFQVFRAVMQDEQDTTECLVLDGNRLEEDILCKSDLDALTIQGKGRGRVIYTLTKGDDKWQGLRGRVDAALVKEHCIKDSETVVLICGPEAMEKSMHQALKADGWNDDQMVFF